MAVGETARLIASLELQDKFSGTLGKANRQLGGFESRMNTATRATRGLGVAGVAVGSALGVLGARLVTAGVVNLIGQFRKGVDAIRELENVTVATATVLQSTGGAAGITANQVRDLAEKFEDLNATMDDKVIQSAENMLLTFTNIRGEAFEPALEAVLDMNEAMGGGPEGLQNIAIQVGKALQDPIRGVTALRRVGVALTEEQRIQIKTLVEQNNLYGAQQIILEELGVEFGGRFTAAGKTAEGQTAKLDDKLEDLQKRLAGPLIPALDIARVKLIGLLDSPTVMAGADRLGVAIASLFSEQNLDRGVALIERGIGFLTSADFSGITGTLGGVAETVGNLPWTSIADAARLLGTGAKALLTAFTSLPPWVQTAVLTGWGLNKLTGGLLGNIVGTLTGALGKVLLQKIGLMTVQAGVVNVSGAIPGTGAPTPVGGGGGLLGVIKTFLGLSSAVVLGGLIGQGIGRPLYEEAIRPAIEYETAQIEGVINRQDPDQIRRAIENLEGGIAELKEVGKQELFGLDLGPLGAIAGFVQQLNVADQIKLQEAQLAILKDLLATIKETSGAGKGIPKPVIGAPKGGGLVELPSIAVQALTETASNTERLPNTLPRVVGSSEQLRNEMAAFRSSQSSSTERVVSTAGRTVDAVNQTRGSIDRGFGELGEVVRSSAKIVSGAGKGVPPSLPKAAVTAGGGVVELPESVSSSLDEIATSTRPLPAGLERLGAVTRTETDRLNRGLKGPLDNIASQASSWSSKQLSAFGSLTAAQRVAASAAQATLSTARQTTDAVNQARGAIGRGFSELGGVVRASRANLRVQVNVTSSVSISETLRRITSARVATGTISEF